MEAWLQIRKKMMDKILTVHCQSFLKKIEGLQNCVLTLYGMEKLEEML